ncbi:hypothetical protein [Myroides sp. WP-1]|uniref:hypothetical protein n=1 Tax=Myroides sp. WP-1 TaxID=2759944 RepID=UPI0015F9B3BF|nr:hypothetical protein [Myroides sp. WP-1]MBB1140898.1 hypothetical protein [Myroides sp. WP-1]
MKLNRVDNIILQDLFKSGKGLFIFTLYSRYKISPKILFESIDKLKENELINVIDEERIEITKSGITKIVKSSSIKHNKEIKINKEFLGPKIKINSFYIPRDFNF